MRLVFVKNIGLGDFLKILIHYFDKKTMLGSLRHTFSIYNESSLTATLFLFLIMAIKLRIMHIFTKINNHHLSMLFVVVIDLILRNEHCRCRTDPRPFLFLLVVWVLLNSLPFRTSVHIRFFIMCYAHFAIIGCDDWTWNFETLIDAWYRKDIASWSTKRSLNLFVLLIIFDLKNDTNMLFFTISSYVCGSIILWLRLVTGHIIAATVYGIAMILTHCIAGLIESLLS